MSVSEPDPALSATEQLAGLRAGRWTAETLLRATLARAETVNPALNAVAWRRDEVALAEAREIDRRRAAGEDVGPLAGMPVSIKDMYAMAGWPLSCGLPARADVVPEDDAAIVRRVREAGGIPFLRTTTAPLTMVNETQDGRVGRVNNPWNPRRTAGGSSGGEAALIAAGGSPWGIGSDMGGSVRLPAHFCGVVGLRATPGRLPTEGQFPDEPTLEPLNAPGVLARRVEDAALLFGVLAGTGTVPALPSTPTLTWIRPRRRLPSHPVGPEVFAGMRRVARALEARLETSAATVDAPEAFADAHAIWQAQTLADGWAWVRRELGVDPAAGSLAVLRLWREARAGRNDLPPALLLLLAGSPVVAPSARTLQGLPARIERLRERWQPWLADGAGVVMMPVYPSAAPLHGALVRGLLLMQGRRLLSWLVAANVLGLPALSVPIGRTQAGLPYGLQLVGAPGSEGILLDVAATVQELAGFHTAGGLAGLPGAGQLAAGAA